MFRTPFPDLHVTIEDMVAERDEVTVRLSVNGTHKGEFRGTPPTGKQIKVQGLTIFRFDRGKIVEQWNVVDIMSIMQQIGAIPKPRQKK
jgi:steroid delta-isomerase-like uncharacterized protein